MYSALPLSTMRRIAYGRLFERRFGIGAVVVEDVHIFQPEILQARSRLARKVFQPAALAARPFPRGKARLGRDDHLVAVLFQIARKDAPEVALRRPDHGAVVVRRIEYVDTVVEGGKTMLRMFS